MTGGQGEDAHLTVGALAELYLGNVLYALELAAIALEGEGKREDATFYRGIARELSLAHGRQSGDRGAAPEAPDSSPHR